MEKRTALEIYREGLNLLNRKKSITPEEEKQLFDEAMKLHKFQSVSLIELSAQLTGVASVDPKIAKMEYIDVYNQYYNINSNQLSKKPLSGVEILVDDMFEESIVFSNKTIEKAKQIEKEQKMEFANWCRIQDHKFPNRVVTIQQLYDEYEKTFK